MQVELWSNVLVLFYSAGGKKGEGKKVKKPNEWNHNFQAQTSELDLCHIFNQRQRILNFSPFCLQPETPGVLKEPTDYQQVLWKWWTRSRRHIVSVRWIGWLKNSENQFHYVVHWMICDQIKILLLPKLWSHAAHECGLDLGT